jgi:hypothetical protein
MTMITALGIVDAAADLFSLVLVLSLLSPWLPPHFIAAAVVVLFLRLPIPPPLPQLLPPIAAVALLPAPPSGEPRPSSPSPP